MIETLLKYLNPQYLIIIGAAIGFLGSYLANEKAGIESKNTNDNVEYIKEVSADTNKQITGGDSYCSLIISFNKLNQPQFFLNHVGETKLENVSITVWDSEKIKKINYLATTDGEAFIKEYKKCSKKIDFVIIYPNTIYPNIPVELDETVSDIDLIIEIRFGNRILRQTITVENYKSLGKVIKNKIEEDGKIINQSQRSV